MAHQQFVINACQSPGLSFGIKYRCKITFIETQIFYRLQWHAVQTIGGTEVKFFIEDDSRIALTFVKHGFNLLYGAVVGN